MKNILFIGILLISCTKYQVNPNSTERVKCPQLDIDNFIGGWTYETINGDTLYLGLLQDIQVDYDSVHNALTSYKWESLYCNVISQEGQEDLIVNIDIDTMYLTGVNTGTIWKLTR